MVHTYFSRIALWKTIHREMRGVGDEDRRVLRRSALAAPFSSFGNLYGWNDPVLLRDAAVEVPGVGRFHLRARSDDLFHVLPSREPEVFAALREHLRPGDTFVDAGANIGVFSVFAAGIVGPEGRVVSIEMMPDTAQVLRRHLEMNGCSQARVVENGLSNVAGAFVEAAVVEGRFGMASIVVDRGSLARRIRVETTTLDDVLADEEEVAVLKMDLEGAELSALRGAGSTLQKIRAIVFEQLQGESGPAEFLRESGFEVRRLRGANFLARRCT